MGSAKASRKMRDMTPHPSAMKLRGNGPHTLQLVSAMFNFQKSNRLCKIVRVRTFCDAKSRRV